MKPLCTIALLLAFITLPGCDEPTADGPPTVRLGESVCEQCNMIISDERWATATVVDGPRGPEPRLFDDFNYQVNYEADHPELEILSRWSHSHTTGEWLRTKSAHFLISPELRTPMGSKVAAFGSASEAQEAQSKMPGDVMPFDAAWDRLGFEDAKREDDKAESDHDKQMHDHGP